LRERLTIQPDAARHVRDLDVLGFDLNELKGKHKGVRSVLVRAHWRLTFHFEAGVASDVDSEDYQ
jgi:plasmid maintenance system killer protein